MRPSLSSLTQGQAKSSQASNGGFNSEICVRGCVAKGWLPTLKGVQSNVQGDLPTMHSPMYDSRCIFVISRGACFLFGKKKCIFDFRIEHWLQKHWLQPLLHNVGTSPLVSFMVHLPPLWGHQHKSNWQRLWGTPHPQQGCIMIGQSHKGMPKGL